MYEAANDAADLLDRMAHRLTMAADEMRRAGRNTKAQADVEAKLEDEKWMRGAKRELDLLIRQVEGPRPQSAPRRG
jgi:hypothetical protein